MAEGRAGIGFYIIILIVGAVIGTVLSGIIGALIPEGNGGITDTVNKLFVSGATLGILDPLKVDLKFFTFQIAFSIKLTISSVIGILVAAVLLKKV